MGWTRSVTFSHAKRLIAASLAAGCPTRRGAGSLLYATRAGVETAGVLAAPLAGEPAPTTWEHWAGCAWTAAWLTARGRHVVGARELLLNDSWKGQLEWLERDGLRRRAHRPDLAAGLTAAGPLVPVEVELATKSRARLRAILALHASWMAAGKSGAVIYVCGPERLADLVLAQGAQVGLAPERKTLRVELLDTVRTAARTAHRHAPWRKVHVAAAEVVG